MSINKKRSNHQEGEQKIMETKTVYIEKYESIVERLISSGKKYWNVSDDEANRTMFNAYCNSKGDNRAMLDFGDVIWDKDVEPIAETLRGADIKEFTISVNQMNIIEILAAFSNVGIVIQGMISIKKRCCEADEAPAFLMKVI